MLFLKKVTFAQISALTLYIGNVFKKKKRGGGELSDSPHIHTHTHTHTHTHARTMAPSLQEEQAKFILKMSAFTERNYSKPLTPSPVPFCLECYI